jgi:hypothetical protein
VGQPPVSLITPRREPGSQKPRMFEPSKASRVRARNQKENVMHKNNVNTNNPKSKSNSGEERNAAVHTDKVRLHIFDVETQATDIEILIAALFDKIDEATDSGPKTLNALTSINCFATCALRNAALIKEGCEAIMGLTSETYTQSDVAKGGAK